MLALTVCDFFESVDCVVIPLAAVKWMNWLNISQKTFDGLIAEKMVRQALLLAVEQNIVTIFGGYVVVFKFTRTVLV